MKNRFLAIILVAVSTAPAAAQVQSILIEAGTPEDAAIQAITKESDDAKRLAMWEEFVAKYASSPAAVAYGDSQIAQHYLSAGDAAKALAYGDKAMAAVPNNLDILMSQTMAAQQLKDNGKIMGYASLGGKAINGIKKAPAPPGVEAADWAAKLEGQRQQVQQQFEFFDGAAFNAVAAEQNAKKRVEYAQKYDESFSDGRYIDQVHQLAITGLLQAQDFTALAKYGEAALAASPNNVATLSLLAYALAEDPNPRNPYLARAMEHARKAVGLGKADAPEADRTIKLSVGLAHEALGYALMKQDKTAAAISEFKSASDLLKDDPGSQEVVLFRLGYAYAKLKRYAEAREALNATIALKGPFEKQARDVLAKVNAAGTAR
ncbi:MAG TPA: tetratricopeptide repeat protein [Terriglobales bacterium]|nr:tetratricopeptide repeat protein [Terriglobales bacterium]